MGTQAINVGMGGGEPLCPEELEQTLRVGKKEFQKREHPVSKVRERKSLLHLGKI